jgi:hypothetical protein
MKISDLNNYTVTDTSGVSKKTLAKEEKNLEEEGAKGFDGFAQGFTKGLLNTSRNVAMGLQTGGQKILAGIDPTKTYEDIRKETGLKSLKNETEEGKAVKDILTPRGKAEKIGKTVENIAEYFVPASGVSKALKAKGALTKIAGQVASDVAVTAAQEGDSKNLLKTAVLSTTLSSLPLVGKLIKSKGVTPTAKAAEKLEQINLRLTPTQKQQLNKSQNQVIKFLAKNKVTGTPEIRLSKIDNLVDVYEGKVQNLIKDSGKLYSKDEIINAVKNLPDEFLAEADNPQVYSQMQRDVNAFMGFVNKQKGNTIEASRINAFKRSFAKNARNKAGDVITNESRQALSDGLYGILQRDIPNLQPINKDYSQVLLAQKLLGKAVGRNEIGLIGNLIGIVAGTSVGGAVGGAVGAAIGAGVSTQVGKTVAGTGVRSQIGAGLQTLSDYLSKAKTTPAGEFIIPKSVIQGLFGD